MREGGHAMVAAAAQTSAQPAGAAEGSWGFAAMGLTIGAHAGLLAVALRGRRSVATCAAAKEAKADKKAEKYVESAADARLFEQVYLEYTSEYLKGPMYWHEDKIQGITGLYGYPGNPLRKNGKMTSNQLGNLKTFSSNELAYLSMLFFAIGLYGNLQFNYYDQQWAKVAMGDNFNVSYIVESLLLPISFFMHIACYIQRINGK